MESDRKLQNLSERAGTLRNNFSHEIKKCITFCKLCSRHGRYCDNAVVPYDEKKRLIAIRDLLKEVENRLNSLQRLQSWQQKDKHAAIRQLEESRLQLLDKVKKHKGKDLDVLSELKKFLARDEHNWDWKPIKNVHTKEVRRKRPVTCFLICCLGNLFNPLRWLKAVVLAVKFLAISASILSTIQIYENRQKLVSSGKNFLLPFGSTGQESKSSQLSMSRKSLDVCNGMG